jgi:hypothetical protein
VTKLSPDRQRFTEQLAQFRVTKEDADFLRAYAAETESGVTDIVRLAIRNLKEAVAKEKKKLAKEQS